MKKNTQNRIGAAVLATLILGGTSGCGKKDEGQLPEQYTVGGEEVPALSPEDAAEVSEEEVDGGVAYTYSGLSSPGGVSGAYAAELTAGETPFSVVDGDWAETELPDFEASEGSVLLAKAAAEDGQVDLIQVDWSEESCTVTVTAQEGAIASSAVGQDSMTLAAAADYINSLPPSALGLDGTSMDQYQVYTLDGAVLVDGRPCMRLKVCSVDNPACGNHISGDYLLSGDKQHLYRLNVESSTVTELSV
jgi:hypothetical protein